MKNTAIKIAAAACLALATLSCTNELKEGEASKANYSEADIIISFTATNPSGQVFVGEITQDTIFIKVNPYLDAKTVLKDCTPKFYISAGATVEPDPTTPQNFSARNRPVTYTVTSYDKTNTHKYVVYWKKSDALPYGEGFSYCEITDGTNADNEQITDGPMGGVTHFTDLGWPGTLRDYYLADGITEKDCKLYGDLDCRIGYCGDYIVLHSRSYAIEGNTDYATQVIDKNTLVPAGSNNLNMGSIPVTALMGITNDWHGHLVGVANTGSTSDIWYWTDPFEAPVKLGTSPVNLSPATDGSNNFQVTGDILGNAYITALADRGSEGKHNMLTVTDGVLQSGCQTISTGYASDDCGGWQCISLVCTEVPCSKPYYLIGDNEGTIGQNWTNQIYLNNWSGATVGTPEAPLLQNNLRSWWVGNGPSLVRQGAHRPYMASMLINGKNYILFVGGTMWWGAAAVLEYDFGMSTLAHNNANMCAYTGTIGYSYGGWGAWYWDEDEKAGYVAAWWGRDGIITRKLTCYE